MFDTNKNVQTVITNKGSIFKYLKIFENWDDNYYYSSFLGFSSKEKILRRSKNYIKTKVISLHFLGIPIPFIPNMEIEVIIYDTNHFKTNFFNTKGYYVF